MGFRHAGATHQHGAAEQIDIGQRLARSHVPGKAISNRGLDLFPRNAASQHRQRVAQIDHLIQTAAKEIGCIVHRRHFRKLPEMNI